MRQPKAAKAARSKKRIQKPKTDTDMERLRLIIKKYMLLEIALLLLAVSLDQAVKQWAQQAVLPHGGAISVVPDIFLIQIYYNHGAMFGVFHSDLVIIYIATAVAAALYMAGMFYFRGRRTAGSVAFALMLGGTAGNFIDRVSGGSVIDIFHVWLGQALAFNIADIAVIVGVVMFVVVVLRGGLGKDGAQSEKGEPV